MCKIGFISSWNLSGILTLPQGNIVEDILENTGYLFILFFGFQEIQAMGRDIMDTMAYCSMLTGRIMKSGDPMVEPTPMASRI